MTRHKAWDRGARQGLHRVCAGAMQGCTVAPASVIPGRELGRKTEGKGREGVGGRQGALRNLSSAARSAATEGGGDVGARDVGARWPEQACLLSAEVEEKVELVQLMVTGVEYHQVALQRRWGRRREV